MSDYVKITRRQEIFLAARLAGDSIVEAAKKAGVTDRQARRWQKCEPFAVALGQARRRAFNDAIDDLRAAAGAAVSRLRLAMNDRNHTIAIRAATELLSQARDFAGVMDLADRIEQLERACATNANSRS